MKNEWIVVREKETSAGRSFDHEKFWEFNKSFLEAYRKKVEMPKGNRLPVFVMEASELLKFLNSSLNGVLVACLRIKKLQSNIRCHILELLQEIMTTFQNY